MTSDTDTGSEKREHYVIEPVRRADTDTGLVEAARNRLNIHARVVDYPGGEIGFNRDIALSRPSQQHSSNEGDFT